jgi:glutaredoxin
LTGPAGRTVTLVSRAGCHLCDEARLVLTDLCRRLGAPLEEKDVDGEPGLGHFSEYVPVFLVGGEVVGWFTVDPARIEGALAGR